MHVTIYPDAELPAALRPTLDAWSKVCFPDAHGITWTFETPWHAVVYEANGQPVSYLDILERPCTVGGQPVNLAGIGGVMTPPEFRGRGYASRALEAAADFMRTRIDAPFALLVTGENRIPFYGRLGWQHIQAPLRFYQPDGIDKSDRIAVIMILSLHGDPWPDGEIDLRGLPW